MTVPRPQPADTNIGQRCKGQARRLIPRRWGARMYQARLTASPLRAAGWADLTECAWIWAAA